MIRKIFFLAILLAIGWLGYQYYEEQNETQSSNGGNGQSIPVEVVKVQTYTIYDEIEALGTAFSNEAVDITANDTDKIVQIFFEDGQEVKAGDVLALLEQDEEQAQKRAEQAQVDEHERELNRLEDLLKRNAAAKNEYDERKTLLAISKERIAEIDARIDDKTIRAPFDGVLGLRKISVGSLVSPGDVITTIDDIDIIKLDFTIPAKFLDVVHEGLKIEAQSDAIQNQPFKGTVTTINPRVDRRTRSVEVRAILQNPQHIIKPGILMSVRLFRNEREALMVPEEAIVQLEQGHYILTVNNQNKIERQEIQIGKRMQGWVEVISGLEQSAQVVIRGVSRVREGDSVTLELKNITFEART